MFEWLKRKSETGTTAQGAVKSEFDRAVDVAVAKRLRDFARLAVEPSPYNRYLPANWVHDRREFVKHYRGGTYAAVSAIARRVAMQEVHVGMRRVKRSGIEIEPVKPTHPLVEMFERVNPRHTSYDLWFLTVAWRLICGVAYWWKIRNGLQVPAELWPVPSHWVRAVPDRMNFIGSYEVRGVFAEPKMIAARDMVDIAEPNVDWEGNGRYYGHPVLYASATMVDIEETMLRQMYSRFKNYSPPGLHYSTDEELQSEQVTEIIGQIMAQHAAAEASGRPIVTHSGYRVDDFSKTVREMDYGKSLQAALDYQLAMFGVPKAVVGIVADVNRANMAGSLMAFAQNTVNPLLIHIGQHLTQNLAAEFDDSLVVWFDPVTVDDMEQTRKGIETLLRAGAVTVNEARDLLAGLGPYKYGGDVPMLPMNMAPAAFGNADPESETPPAQQEPETPAVPRDDGEPKEPPPDEDGSDESGNVQGEDELTPAERKALVNRVAKHMTERRAAMVRHLLNGSHKEVV